MTPSTALSSFFPDRAVRGGGNTASVRAFSLLILLTHCSDGRWIAIADAAGDALTSASGQEAAPTVALLLSRIPEARRLDEQRAIEATLPHLIDTTIR